MAYVAMVRHNYRRRRGFTLIEMIVALAVLSVASWIIAGLFTASMNLGERARHERLAAEIAEEALLSICTQPHFYRWGEDGAPRTALFSITPANDSEVRPIVATAPATLPTEPRAAARNRGEYERFTWQAYGRRPGADADYFEVSVVVRWVDNGRERVFSLSRVVAVERVEEGA